VYEGWWDKAVNGKLGSYIPWFEHPPLGGVARWKLRANGPAERYLLRFSHAGGIYEKELRVGGRYYASPFRAYGDGRVQGVEIVMRPVRLGGVIGGIDWLFCPGWLLAYLLIAIPFIGVIKRLCRIH
jgi:hypothetical protein